MAPRTLGRYELLRRIGEGGMAEIWKARIQGPAGFEKFVAVKKVLPQYSEDTEFIEMFVREARIVARLAHPNIVQVLDFGEADSAGSEEPGYYIVMEYVAGRDLGSLLKRLRNGKNLMPEMLSLYTVLMAARGLSYAHALTDQHGRALGLVHRDVSPSNILLSFGGEAKVTDFGIAKVTSALSKTTVGVLKGKMRYMSPEQRSLKPLDQRSDVFGLGLILYEMLTNLRLFDGTSNAQIYKQLGDYTGLTDEHRTLIPPMLFEIVDRCLQVDPDRRFQTANDLEAELAAILDARGIIEARRRLGDLMRDTFHQDHQTEVADEPEESEASEVIPTAREKSVSVLLITDMIEQAMVAGDSVPAGAPTPELAAPPPPPSVAPSAGTDRAERSAETAAPVAAAEEASSGLSDAGVYFGKGEAERVDAPRRPRSDGDPALLPPIPHKPPRPPRSGRPVDKRWAKLRPEEDEEEPSESLLDRITEFFRNLFEN